jgi:uncharacterized membrane protein
MRVVFLRAAMDWAKTFALTYCLLFSVLLAVIGLFYADALIRRLVWLAERYPGPRSEVALRYYRSRLYRVLIRFAGCCGLLFALVSAVGLAITVAQGVR